MSTKQTRFNVKPQDKRLYSYNLQENLYLEQFSKKNTSTVYPKQKFLALKRHLHSMRFYATHKNIQSIPFQKKSEFYLDFMHYNNLIFLEPLILILPLGLSRINSIPNVLDALIRTKVSSSFHAAFSFIENKWESASYALEAEMPSSLHPEMLIRMIGLRIQDVAFIDLLRRRLHTTSLKLAHPSAYTKHGVSKKLITILWNLWALEFEDFLQKECISLLDQVQISCRNSKSFLQKLHFLNLQILDNQIKSDTDFYENIEYIQYRSNVRHKNPKSSNYLRYANNWLIGIEGKLFVVQALKRRCIRFWKRRIGILMISSRLKIICLYQDNSWFLGSLLKLKLNEVKIQLKRSDTLLLPISILKKKSLLVTLPLVSLVKLLSEYGFCKSNGYPISKSSWSILPDLTIIEKFSQILVSISCHYSGCINKKKLSNIQYILCYSCAKTLACKHKTNVRSIWYTYANEFTHNHLSLEIIDTLNLDLITPINRIFIKQKRITIWDLNHIDPDPMVLFLIEGRNKKNII
jgi:Type II intron maturase/MatK/TrnK amino terminal region